nr:hypothetical protein [Pseudodesulfovibrio sp.]
MWEDFRIFDFHEDGAESTSHKWDVSDCTEMQTNDLFKHKGYSKMRTLGDEDSFECTVFEHKDGNEWIFDVYDGSTHLAAYRARSIPAYINCLKLMAETCIAVNTAEHIANA